MTEGADPGGGGTDPGGGEPETSAANATEDALPAPKEDMIVDEQKALDKEGIFAHAKNPQLMVKEEPVSVHIDPGGTT